MKHKIHLHCIISFSSSTWCTTASTSSVWWQHFLETGSARGEAAWGKLGWCCCPLLESYYWETKEPKCRGRPGWRACRELWIIVIDACSCRSLICWMVCFMRVYFYRITHYGILSHFNIVQENAFTSTKILLRLVNIQSEIHTEYWQEVTFSLTQEAKHNK